ncbi:MAG: CCA tRNA nucleotidyltransferase [Thermoplasmata archaeon]|nr:MAG: CCA tRNA nucleotidyltransferase [Thermoplasmata archaeon]
MDVEAEVLGRIAPNERENKLLRGIVEKVGKKVISIVNPMDLEVTPILVGSVAKGTHLKDPDIDIFVMFPSTTSREDLESIGLKIGKEVLGEWEKKYAEHPYVYGKFEGMNVEIVPCYKIQDPSQKMSAVDRTPFHTNFIIENLNDGQKDQVRLLKQFLKGIGIYGAEAEIEGFSGYLCELLVLHYEDFNGVIKGARDWSKGILITFDDRKHAEFDDCLIVVDPVDPKRNVASALSKENFAIFIHACREYHANPRIEFFFPNIITPKHISEIETTIKNRATTLLGITFKKPQTLPDILHSQLRKSLRSIVMLCEKFGFRLIDSDYFVNDEVMFLLEFEVFSLPMAKPHKGPPVWHDNASDFLSKWTTSSNLIKGPYIKNGNWYVDIKRDFRNPKELIEIKLDTLSLGRHIIESMNTGFKTLVGLEVLDDRYASWLTMFLDKKFRWDY